MLANLLRAVVLAAVLLAALALLVAYRHGAPSVGVALVVALVAAVPAVLALEVALMHAINRRTGGQVPRRTLHSETMPPARLRDLLRAWWGEVQASVVVFAWRQPFRDRAVPDVPAGTVPLPGLGVETRRGVLLVHGYCCNRGLWNPWIEQFRARGVTCMAVDLEPVFGSIDDYAPIVDAAVRRLQHATGLAPVLVGHSMGGLAIRAWMRRAGASAQGRLHHVVTIGTPHHGTWLGRAGHTVNARQMALDSAWLRDLTADEDPAIYRRFTCFWSHCDNIVFPAASATLPGADNRHVEAVAHVDLINPAPVLREVLSCLNRPIGLHDPAAEPGPEGAELQPSATGRSPAMRASAAMSGSALTRR
jgi:hypothetical protein